MTVTDPSFKIRETESHVFFVSGPFSQWHISPFDAPLPKLVGTGLFATIEPGAEIRHFSHAEQAMMASKASVFSDGGTLAQILASTSPKEQKELGRKVGNFDAGTWNTVALRIVTLMNHYKFSANSALRDDLLATGDKHIVEGAWYDTVWGVGLAWDDPAIDDPQNWKGTNWLGEALMAVRKALRGNDSRVDPWTLY
jgi:hypothetical protein